jgi:hypothetical protein
MANLGRLERIDLREAWDNEATAFTPWLSSDENIALLGNAIGIELEVEAQEQSVGPFKADILCKDTADDHFVLIENQLERTDHKHLGQLLTYAAGLHAVTIVWIADRFIEEHRAAIDWLNEITSGEFHFFGLEIELWKIGDSPIAPKFNIVCKPNDWTADVSRVTQSITFGELTETKRLQLEYWTQLQNVLAERGSQIHGTKPRPQHWNNFSIGRSAFRLVATITTQKQALGVEIYCGAPHALAHFELLREQQDEIETEMNTELEWMELPGKKACRIIKRKLDTDPANKTDWAQQHAWIADQLELMHATFRTRIRELNADDYVADHDDNEDED